MDEEGCHDWHHSASIVCSILFFVADTLDFYVEGAALENISCRRVGGGGPLKRDLLTFDRHIGQDFVEPTFAGHVHLHILLIDLHTPRDSLKQIMLDKLQ